MKTFIILLRAVNVSGKNIIKMTDLKAQLEQYDFKEVKTYIQSGNILLQCALPAKDVQSSIQNCISTHFGLDINVFVLDEQKLNNILQQNPFAGNQEGNKVYITILDKEPEKDLANKFKEIDLGKEEYILAGDIFYFYLPEGMAKSKLSNPFIESKLKVIATGRNLNTMVKLQQLAVQIN
ncbi:DUF1697 domain-containing protein [Sphingobacterium bovistauri]|uniref:DUF1697 domain-containing protein n=1 Tax=Sphingobacterium bovistauri TaxID=2781959 RepID=A0ABS7Z4K0_9SPHI|nr:DUF1697 domain-containing protein [Sphingobacterium bovistauri]MCA5005116.1 DUF1697 domain-containing protein [Sphingobacterium bovistauri]